MTFNVAVLASCAVIGFSARLLGVMLMQQVLNGFGLGKFMEAVDGSPSCIVFSLSYIDRTRDQKEKAHSYDNNQDDPESRIFLRLLVVWIRLCEKLRQMT
jgi:hypothetical protein